MKKTGIITLIVIAVAAVGFFLMRSESGTQETKIADAGKLVREDSSIAGNPNAKVTVVEFLDFQCSACRTANPIVKQMIAEYGDRIKYVQRYFPIPFHKHGELSALAAAAAAEQGKIWEMTDKLYDNQDEWSGDASPVSDDQALEKMQGYAREIGLNVDQFTQSVKEKKNWSIIQRDLQDAQALGVNATPTFYFNGQKRVGVPSYQELKNTLDNLLKE